MKELTNFYHQYQDIFNVMEIIGFMFFLYWYFGRKNKLPEFGEDE